MTDRRIDTVRMSSWGCACGAARGGQSHMCPDPEAERATRMAVRLARFVALGCMGYFIASRGCRSSARTTPS